VAEFQLADGGVVHFRHVQPQDEPLVADAISTSSRETLLHRFFSPIRQVSSERLRAMLTIDRKKETCIVVVVTEKGDSRIVCGARFVRLAKANAAEIALTVHDDFQRRGLGSFMLRLLIRLGRAEGLRCFEAYVMTSNVAMLRLLNKVVPASRNWQGAGDVQHIIFDLKAILI